MRLKESKLSRIITVEGTGTERTRLCKSIVVALRELMKQKEPDAHSYDLVAYIGLALLQIDANIEKTVIAWEKKDYWLKADKFRMQWNWAKPTGEKICNALEAGDWATIAMQAATTGQKLNTIKVSENHRLGAPWVGAWTKYQGMK
jgi:hypothetical protein